MAQITRKQFIDAIELGIKAARLNETEIQLLRHVARTETITNWGTFDYNKKCFCPLAAAGIWAGEDTIEEEEARRLSPFYGAFDEAIFLLQPSGFQLEIV